MSRGGCEKGVRSQKPVRPYGCFALLTPDPVFAPAPLSRSRCGRTQQSFKQGTVAVGKLQPGQILARDPLKRSLNGRVGFDGPAGKKVELDATVVVLLEMDDQTMSCLDA